MRCHIIDTVQFFLCISTLILHANKFLFIYFILIFIFIFKKLYLFIVLQVVYKFDLVKFKKRYFSYEFEHFFNKYLKFQFLKFKIAVTF